MKVIDLFPDCTKDSCEDAKKGKSHKHILPKQQELLDSKERFIALVGGYGSAKTTQVCVLGHLLSMAIPGNRGIIVRRSLPKLHDSTERIFLEVLQRSGEAFTPREMRDGWPGRIIYPNGSEIFFRETRDLGRFLGPEYGWFYIDEAQEEPERTFRDLVGRLRLPVARHYLRGIITTNPPHSRHWIAKRWPEEGVHIEAVKLKDKQIRKISYRMIRSSTYDNPFLSSDYVAGILESNTPAEAKRIIEGYYGFQQDGKPVYTMFDFFRNVADPPTRMMTLYRVWDFGFHCPAVLWSQMFKCKFGSVHWNVLYELMGADIEAIPFGAEVLEETKSAFKEIPKTLILEGGDTAGAQISDKGPGAIILLSRPYNIKNPEQGGYDLMFKHQRFPDIDPGLDLVRLCLRTSCKCGVPLLVIHRRCRNLIDALAGGYHYPKERAGAPLDKTRKPVKDGFYDNITDALRYTAELFYRPLSNGVEEDIMKMLMIDGQIQPAERWGWMEGHKNIIFNQ